MSKPKIDLVKLDKMLREGMSYREIAKLFSCTPGAISQARKKLSIDVVKNVALENAHRVVNQKLNAVEQLQKINDYANELLDLLMRWNRGDEEALQVLESQVRKVRVKNQEESVKEYKFKDPRDLALKAMAEIRGQLNLQLEIFKTLYDLKAVEEFQREVLTAIGEVKPSVRDRIIHNLQKARAIRSTVEFHKSGV
jgi:hypothetical protein